MSQIKVPPPEILSSIYDILEERDVFIPQDHIEMTIAVMTHWLKDTKRGHEYMAHLLGLKHQKGTHDKKYLLHDEYTALTKEIKPESIVFLKGCVAEGKTIPLGLLEVQEREDNQCEGCGASVICEQEFENSKLCSYCLSGSGSTKARDAIELDCENCTYTKCNWNPVNQKNALMGF